MGASEPSTHDHTGLRYRFLWMLIGFGLLATIIALSLLSVPGPPGPPGVDKLYHLLAYGALMGWWGMVLPRRRVAWAIGLLLMGGVLEWLQSLTGYRTLDRIDAVANAAGILLALLLLRTPLGELLAWLDRQLADRLDTGAP